MILNCVTCGIECVRTGQRQKYCKACAKSARAEYVARYQAENLEAIRAKNRARTDPEVNRARTKEWAAKNPERAKAQAAKTYAANKDRAIARATAWNAENLERRREISRESARRRRVENPAYFSEMKRKLRQEPRWRLNVAMSEGMRVALNSGKAGASWESIVGYTLGDLIAHLTALFSDGMSLSNYGDWHIDHKRPIASFNFSDASDSEFQQCWALDNLQPLWAIDNLRKNSFWDGKLHRRAIDADQRGSGA